MGGPLNRSLSCVKYDTVALIGYYSSEAIASNTIPVAAKRETNISKIFDGYAGQRSKHIPSPTEENTL